MSTNKTSQFRLKSIGGALLSGGVLAAGIQLIPWMLEDAPKTAPMQTLGDGSVPPTTPKLEEDKLPEEKTRKEAEIAAQIAKDRVLEATNTAKSKALEAQLYCDKAHKARCDAVDAVRVAENAAKSSDLEMAKNMAQAAKQAAKLASEAAKAARQAANQAKEQASLASSNAYMAEENAKIAFSYEASAAVEKAKKAKAEAGLAMRASHINAQDAERYATQANEAEQKAQQAYSSIANAAITDADSSQDLLRASKQLIVDLVNATNSGSISGQADCYAPVVSAYFDKGRCTKSEIIQDLARWRSAFSYYHMNVHSWHTATHTNMPHGADCYVEIIADLSWRKKGRLTVKKFALSYYIKSKPTPLIVAAATRAL